MFCFQCQETAKNTGCTVKGVCGKQESLANLQDLLIYILKGISVYGEKAKELGIVDKKAGFLLQRACLQLLQMRTGKRIGFLIILTKG